MNTNHSINTNIFNMVNNNNTNLANQVNNIGQSTTPKISLRNNMNKKVYKQFI
jgi:hypothetical protein